MDPVKKTLRTDWMLHFSKTDKYVVFDEFSYYKTIYGDFLQRNDFYDISSPFLMDSQLNKTSSRIRKKKIPSHVVVPEKLKKTSEYLETVAKNLKELMGKQTGVSQNKNYNLKEATKIENPSIFYSENDFSSISQKIITDNEIIETDHGEGMIFQNLEKDIKSVQASNGQTFLCPPMSSFLSGQANLTRHLPNFGLTFDLIVMDPPWQNRSVKRKHTYSMFSNDDLMKLGIPKLLTDQGLLAIWVTNSERVQAAAESALKKWGLTLVARWHWLKITKKFEPVCEFRPHHKVPFETIFLATRTEYTDNYSFIPEDFCFASVPHGCHSKKPPIQAILEFLQVPVGEKRMEIYARCLQEQFLSVGFEPLHFQELNFFQNGK
ncbi:hypothetical protein L596_002734 [Steinernema carpocapsae]|uniref:Methyltransferase-like protein 4 n=1 Tax=Steinernema carpocapsae TaxID=34508 RepID=A0A4V6I7T6_STECR|nr:hypothetical protein L596_002734 [Steinernema carpocapsae]